MAREEVEVKKLEIVGLEDMIKSFQNLEVYQRWQALAMFMLAKNFLKEETYSLTSPVIRSSRSAVANISVGWAKQSYVKVCRQFLVTSLGLCSKTPTWLAFARDCNYITREEYAGLSEGPDATGKMLTQLHEKWKTK